MRPPNSGKPGLSVGIRILRLIECLARENQPITTFDRAAIRSACAGCPSTGAIIARSVALTSGIKLGPYEIIAPLGAGGMGEVYRARDTRLDRDVAVKVLPANLSSDPNLRQRLEREAKAVSKISHPHICTLHDIGHQDGMDFLIMGTARRRDAGAAADERAAFVRTDGSIRCADCRRAGQGA